MQRLTLGYQVLIAAVLGIGAGVFFGPLCGAVQPVSEIYFTLLQMVALPYIFIALIHGLGSMTPALGKKLFKRGWPFWLALWAIVFGSVYALNLMVPNPLFTTIEAGTDEGAKLARNFLNYLVPENPIYDLANNVIPAIVAGGFIFGVALMHLKSKEPILSFLDKGTQLVEKILHWIALASPIGIFAHLAVVFGTVSFEDVYSLSFYVASFIAATLLITFWVLPAILSSLTPLTYGEVLKAFRTVCLLPFATALPTLSLPFIIYYMKKLGHQHHEGDPHFQATSQTVLPICYSFGQIGNGMILFFILFLTFYFRHPFTGWEKAILSLFMLPMSVGSSTTSVSTVAFLIEQLRFPLESVDIFKQTTAITMNFQVLLSTAGIFTFIVLSLYSYYGAIKVRWLKLAGHAAGIVAVSAFAITLAKFTIHLRDSYIGQFMDLRVSEIIEYPVHAKILTKAVPQVGPKTDPFERIVEKGILRVGYSPLDIPFSYINHMGELVGYDIAYAHQLARDLDCTLEFVSIDFERFAEQLENGEFDIAMSAVAMDENRIKVMDFSMPYEEQNVVLIVPSKRVSHYLDLPSLETRKSLKVVAYGVWVNIARRHFPYAQITELTNATSLMLPLLTGDVDIALWTRIQGFAWCLNHPRFVPVDYGGMLGKCYLAYPVAMYSNEWMTFLNHWLALKAQSGFKEKMTRYWLKGESVEIAPPRWSILRNVLHWID